MFSVTFLFSHSRHISSIRGELVPYLVRKQFSKTTNRQTAKDDGEDQKQQLKKSDSSTNNGQCVPSLLFSCIALQKWNEL